MYSKEELFAKAIEITKEHARGGGSGSIEGIFESVYNKLKEIAEADEIAAY